MAEPSQVVLNDRRADRDTRPTSGWDAVEIDFAIYDDLAAVEPIWRELEQQADCTVFQAFDWLAAWQRHIGRRDNVTPVIVVGRENGEELFLLPLAIVPGIVRRLTWLGSDLCDYNAPLLATPFSDRVPAARFPALWDEISKVLQGRPQYRHDVIDLTKMPETLGAQANPMLTLDVGLNASGAYVSELCGNWDEYYQAKRSPATRGRDRSKRKRLGRFGEVRLVTPQETTDVTCTLETLFAQKAKALARMGVHDVFARPGYREFFFDLALNPATRHMVHVSRLDVGPIPAATNVGLIFRDSYYHVLASYDDGEVSRFGPGAAHLRDLLRFAIDLGCRWFDFTIGDEPYKLEWSDRSVKLYDYVAAATRRGWPIASLTLARNHLKRAIKQDARLWQAFTQMRSTLGSRSGSA